MSGMAVGGGSWVYFLLGIIMLKDLPDLLQLPGVPQAGAEALCGGHFGAGWQGSPEHGKECGKWPKVSLKLILIRL